MEDDHSFYIFLFLPWKKIFSVKISFVSHGRQASFLHFLVSSMEDRRFFSVYPLSAVAEAPRPFGFLISVGCRSSDYFFFSVIGPLVTEGEGMLLAVFSYHGVETSAKLFP